MHIRRKEPLGPYTTLALGGCAAALALAGNEADLGEALDWARAEGLPVVPLGQGSNVVVAGDVDALVLRVDTRGIDVLEDRGDTVVLRVAAGENWHRLVHWSLTQGLFGLENLALIPGTVGAAPIQNIGAYGVELEPFVRQVHCIRVADGGAFSLAGEECGFGYRDSVFKHALRDKVLITAVDLVLSRRPRVRADYPALAQALAGRGIVDPAPMEVFDAVVDIRRSKLPDPAQLPNAGSFFKNPVVGSDRAGQLGRRFPDLPRYPQADGSVKLPAAWLIEHCGWKGYRREGLGIHPEHALVIVNYGNGSGAALLELADEVAASVREAFDIALEMEPRVYGGRQ